MVIVSGKHLLATWILYVVVSTVGNTAVGVHTRHHIPYQESLAGQAMRT